MGYEGHRRTLKGLGWGTSAAGGGIYPVEGAHVHGTEEELGENRHVGMVVEGDAGPRRKTEDANLQ